MSPDSAYFFEELLDVKKYCKYTSNVNFESRGPEGDMTHDVMHALTHWSYQYYLGK